MFHKRKIVSLVPLIFLCLQLRGSTTDFVVGSLTFRVLSETKKTVEVVRNDTLLPIGEVTIPGTVRHDGKIYATTKIDDGAFLCCDQLKAIIMPVSLKNISDRAFYGCRQLARINFGKQVDSIGHYAFTDCTALTEISLPSSLVFIGRASFKGCRGLKRIQAGSAQPPTLSGTGILDSFAGTDRPTIVVTVPTGCADLYHTSRGWSQFAHITDRNPSSNEVLLSIVIEGNGHLLYNDIELPNGSTYALPRGETAEMVIQAGDDHILQHVYLNGKDYASTMRGDTLNIPAMTGNTLMCINFAQRNTYLTLCHDENGSMQIDVVENRPVRLHIKPNAGWRIFKVTVDGEDVTGELDCENALTIEKTHRGMAIRVVLEKNGQYAVWKSNGVMSLHDATSPIEIPEDAVCADLTSCAGIDVWPNGNPNTIYIVSRNAEIPQQLNGHNIVVDNQSELLSLTDGHDAFLPFDIQAEEVTYTRIPTMGTNGHGGWDTIVLPFGVQSVTNMENGEQIDWRHGVDDVGHRFWLRGFTGTDGSQSIYFDDVVQWEANEPYLIAVPSDTWGDFYDLRGKPLCFTANQTIVHATKSMQRTWYPFTLLGTLSRKTVNGYVLNDSGDAFIRSAEGEVNPFRCHLTADDKTGVARIAIHSGITQILAPNNETESTDGPIFHINGIRMNKNGNLPHGMYIQNGKKTSR